MTSRQGQPHGVLLSTVEPIEVLQEWCEGACAGDWAVELDDLDLDTGVKTLRLTFAEAGDKAAFIARFGRVTKGRVQVPARSLGR